MISFDDQETINEAKVRLEKHTNGSAPLVADLRYVCYRAVLTDADEHTFNRFLQMYREAELHEEKERISMALSDVRDVELLKRVLQFAMSDDVRSQDTLYVIMSVTSNKNGRDIAWQFLKDHWQEFVDRYQVFLVASLVKSVIERFQTESAAQEIEQFFLNHVVPGTERAVQQALETVRINAAWLRRDLASTTVYLQPYH